MAWRPHQSDENAYQKKEPVGRESEAHPAIISVPRARRRAHRHQPAFSEKMTDF
jgi:hypothetical protein